MQSQGKGKEQKQDSEETAPGGSKAPETQAAKRAADKEDEKFTPTMGFVSLLFFKKKCRSANFHYSSSDRGVYSFSSVTVFSS